MKTVKISVSTTKRVEFVDITSKIDKVVRDSKIISGVCYIFVPHTTAGVTINENADPNVVKDIITELNKIVPFDDGYMHSEGNSAAHIKASVIGFSQIVIIEDNSLQLGTWQTVYFCEFDGPRTRQVLIKILPSE